MIKTVTWYHFVGIGGIGMSGIAQILLERGCKVTGSDLRLNEQTKRIEQLGGVVYEGHRAENLGDADYVVYSSAIPIDNPELEKARNLGIKIYRRAEMLSELMGGKKTITVSGSHGKTTTTSMISLILESSGYDPTVLIGGELNQFCGNAKLGRGDFVVTEADESDGSLLAYDSHVAVITNIDNDHIDFYGSIGSLIDTFSKFANRVDETGYLVACGDDPNVRKILEGFSKRVVTYGLDKENDFYADQITMDGFESHFKVYSKKKQLGEMDLVVPGKHNVLNSLAAVACCMKLGVGFEDAKKSLSKYGGVCRRFQVKADLDRILVVDDYAHHPSEIKATVEAAQQCGKERLIVVYQPHRFTRTELLCKDFAASFDDVDILILTDIYAADEAPIEGVSTKNIADNLHLSRCKEIYYIKDFVEISKFVKKIMHPGDLIISMGAGDVWKIGDELANFLRGKEAVNLC